ncbi:MAG: hypothetical protein R2712_27110 [Vicinamibacterales bacterium]
MGIYLLSVAITGAYVVLQEVKVHNLGGRNVYDPNDVVASIIGLVMMFIVFARFGVVEESSQR